MVTIKNLLSTMIGKINENTSSVNALSEEIATKAPAYTYGTEDLESGVSTLETGKVYFVYE